MKPSPTLTLDGRTLPIEGERNLLEIIRKAGIDVPTFCYHSELSVYGACRLCMVQVEGRGLVPSCSTPPEAGMAVCTHNEKIREYRRVVLELLLANHDQQCPTCPKNTSCQLQALARRLGIEKVRFSPTEHAAPVDASSLALVRDPNKCILCGDCVRVCSEIQSVGAIDLAHRGARTCVTPAFGRDLARVECVYCGQCARVCPTGALTPRSEVDAVWKALGDTGKTVVAQIAPAVRTAVGEMFGLEAGASMTGQIVGALRALGFARVYDTSFAADLTVLEETAEFLDRAQKGEKLPLMTSCCPAWVRFMELYYPDWLPNLSTCRSPQQMFGAVAKRVLPDLLKTPRENLVVVSVMPCTAKKAEARRPEFAADGSPDVDFVLTTQELARMIAEAGLDFKRLQPESFDMPFGFKTGAGVIFGASGGVSEAVLRCAAEKITGCRQDAVEYEAVRGTDKVRTVKLALNGRTLTLGLVHGLAAARSVMRQIKAGRSPYDLVEVMACPGGCVGGAGQPVSAGEGDRRKRAEGLYENDRMLQLRRSQDNPYLADLYRDLLGPANGPQAHALLHTHYQSRRRVEETPMTLVRARQPGRVEVEVCFGTGCYLRGAQTLFKTLVQYIGEAGLTERVELKTSFCFERCNRGPVVRVGETVIERGTWDRVRAALDSVLGVATA